ncbi:hypothetical protein [Dactylosporangium sp. NPDC051541]|uniref:hypothetical protein n=1 Tax=Dactylosporangium sp. NPDC051541 TaxID=3363977 RepID=UPI0037A6945D
MADPPPRVCHRLTWSDRTGQERHVWLVPGWSRYRSFRRGQIAGELSRRYYIQGSWTTAIVPATAAEVERWAEAGDRYLAVSKAAAAKLRRVDERYRRRMAVAAAAYQPVLAEIDDRAAAAGAAAQEAARERQAAARAAERERQAAIDERNARFARAGAGPVWMWRPMVQRIWVYRTDVARDAQPPTGRVHAPAIGPLTADELALTVVWRGIATIFWHPATVRKVERETEPGGFDEWWRRRLRYAHRPFP